MSLRPGQALILTLAVPGLGHVLNGQAMRGALAFVSTVGLFALGYMMVGDRLWFMEFMPQQEGVLRAVPLCVLPEFFNFGCMMVVASLREVSSPDVMRHVLLPREGEDFWLLLTGMSGYVACLWAADAWWLARGQRLGKAVPALAAAAAWLVPGLGHVLVGQKSKGILVGAAVLILFFAGLAFGGGHSVERSSFTLWWAGQALCGLGVIFAALVTAPMQMESYPEALDLGYILCTCAGLANVIMVTDAFTIAEESSPDVSDSATATATDGPKAEGATA